jgi:hypothetical protein
MWLGKLYSLLLNLIYRSLQISIRSLEISIDIVRVVSSWDVKLTTVDFCLYEVVVLLILFIY